MKRWNKKAEGELLSPIIFIIANIIFFGILILFVYNLSSGALVYEEAYAKEIGLLLDKAKPGTSIYVDFEKGYEFISENKIPLTHSVNISEQNVSVKLTKGTDKPYVFQYFSDNEVQLTFSKNENYVLVEVK